MRSFRIKFLAAFLPLLGLSSCAEQYASLQPGDIVFQSSADSVQGQAVKEATGSPYTHFGMVFVDGRNQKMVIEAVGPVKITPLKEFVSASSPGTFCAKRLKQPVSPEAFARGVEWASAQLGKSYDGSFRWSDDSIYCSELVWKTYAAAGIDLCKPRPFRSYDLKQPTVKEIIHQRYGSVSNLPLDEVAVAPGDLANSPLLADVPLNSAMK